MKTGKEIHHGSQEKSLRGNIWHIDERIRSEQVMKGKQTESLCRSFPHLASETDGASYTLLTRILANQHLKAVDRDTQDLRFWCDCIGHLSLNEIHQATIEPHLEARRKQVSRVTRLKERCRH